MTEAAARERAETVYQGWGIAQRPAAITGGSQAREDLLERFAAALLAVEQETRAAAVLQVEAQVAWVEMLASELRSDGEDLSAACAEEEARRLRGLAERVRGGESNENL